VSVRLGVPLDASSPSSGSPLHTYLTADLPALGGRIKVRPEDFLVEEQPLYQPVGSGEHIYLMIEKRNLSTLSAARILAKHFGVHLNAVGFAGLKDKRAITRQVFSIYAPGRKPEDFPMLRYDSMSVLWTDLHANKLRKGHLAGNRFSIKVRDVDMSKAPLAARALARLEKSGVPNRIGDQRFGYTKRNHLVGRGIVLADWQGVLDALLLPRQAHEMFFDTQDAARQWYAGGDFQRALEAFSFHSRTERRVLAALARGERLQKAVGAIERPELEFYLSAFQSAAFNEVLDRRLRAGTLAELHEGDVAMKHENRAMFSVGPADLTPELRERLARQEVSPTGPMWAMGMMRATGETDAIELAALASLGVTLEILAAFEQRRPNRLAGARRPLRVQLTDPDVEGGIDEHGHYVRLAFDLPRGAFATEVLREIMKPEHAPGAPPSARDEDDEENERDDE